MTIKDMASEPYLPFGEIEDKARRFQIESVRLLGHKEQFLGLLLLRPDANPGEIERALKQLSLAPRRSKILASKPFLSPADPKICAFDSEDLDCQTGLLNRNGFAVSLAIELQRVEKTRLPCALLLIETESNSLHAVAERIAQHIQQVEILARYDKRIFALILPGTNMGKAIKRATRIREAIAEEKDGGANVGLAICHSGKVLDSDTFVGMAARELARAKDRKSVV